MDQLAWVRELAGLPGGIRGESKTRSASLQSEGGARSSRAAPGVTEGSAVEPPRQPLVELPGGADHLLEFMTRTLVSHDIPKEWNVPFMIILAKVASPTEAKHLRPISMGSAACKLFSRMLLNRTPALRGGENALPMRGGRKAERRLSLLGLEGPHA